MRCFIIRLINQKNAWSAITDFLKIKILILKNLSVMVVMIYQWCVMNWKILKYSKYKVFMTDEFYEIWLIIKLLIF